MAAVATDRVISSASFGERLSGGRVFAAAMRKSRVGRGGVHRRGDAGTTRPAFRAFSGARGPL